MVQHEPYNAKVHHINMAAQTLYLTVHGMTCANCARTIERKLTSTPGVTKASVNLEATRATVEYDTDLVKPDVLANAVRELGYEVAA
jgi:copper chaperone CopZ